MICGGPSGRTRLTDGTRRWCLIIVIFIPFIVRSRNRWVGWLYDHTWQPYEFSVMCCYCYWERRMKSYINIFSIQYRDVIVSPIPRMPWWESCRITCQRWSSDDDDRWPGIWTELAYVRQRSCDSRERDDMSRLASPVRLRKMGPDLETLWLIYLISFSTSHAVNFPCFTS